MKRKQSAALMSMSAATRDSLPADAAYGAPDLSGGEIRIDDVSVTTEAADASQTSLASPVSRDVK